MNMISELNFQHNKELKVFKESMKMQESKKLKNSNKTKRKIINEYLD